MDQLPLIIESTGRFTDVLHTLTTLLTTTTQGNPLLLLFKHSSNEYPYFAPVNVNPLGFQTTAPDDSDKV